MCHCEISKERATHSMETIKVLVLHPAHCKQNREKGIKLNWHGDQFGLSSLMTVTTRPGVKVTIFIEPGM